MEEVQCDSESSDTEDWKTSIFEERIEYNWLNYNPNTFSPLDEYFYRTGQIPKIPAEDKSPPESWAPVFLIGCGRSGTTVIAKILSAHSDISFINEPRTLWMQVFPYFDVWSALACNRTGQLAISSKFSLEESEKIHKFLYSVTETIQKPLLLEKTPENTFRLDWLNQLFPGCKFIMVKRNPIQTARSISRFQPDTWFGFEDYKWKQLLEIHKHYNVNPIQQLINLPNEFLDCAEKSVFAKALTEWALSTLSAEEFKIKLTPFERENRFFELHLENFMRNTDSVIDALLKFLKVRNEPSVKTLASQMLHRELILTCSPNRDCLKEGTTEEDLLAMAGSTMRNLIFQHTFHT